HKKRFHISRVPPSPKKSIQLDLRGFLNSKPPFVIIFDASLNHSFEPTPNIMLQNATGSI
ncbi:hypothetical protein N9168_02745, partial [Akkermansiaceae bacterium]|nr:hypothetical protein [Akkermansiaceae bacterium]